ncbi:hypothetical protein GF322_03105 [Candidatus Dependentiae bacterium]|nr:hypothetical protein [Candidatus Dependentiae bacterium]
MNVKNLYSFFYFLPFVSFLFGYFIIYIFAQKQIIYTPNVIGKNLQTGINIAAKKGLSIKLLREKEDWNLPEGIILDQLPKPQSIIRVNQCLLLTISKKPKGIAAPNFLGQNQKFITSISSKMGLSTKIFWIKSLYPFDTCIAQYPQYDQELDKDRKLITYISQGNQSLYVVPNLKGLPINEVKRALEREKVQVEIFNTAQIDRKEMDNEIKIIDQKPMSGSIIDLSKPLFMQLQI